MRDANAVFRLRARLALADVIYWLRVAGYEPGGRALSQSLYILYLIALGLLWFAVMGGYVFQSARQIGDSLSGQAAADLLGGLAWAALLIQVWAMVTALRSTPLKLSFADMAYVAGSPVKRYAPVFANYVQQAILRFALLAIPFILIPPLLYRFTGIPGDQTGLASLRALLLLAPWIALTWAGAWLLGILRLIDDRVGRARGLWLLPLLLIPLAIVAPDALLLSGRALGLGAIDQAPAWLPIGLAAAAAAIVAVFVWMGNRVDMIRAADESAIYARVHALGLMAILRPQLQARIRLQVASAGRKPFLHLPRSQGFGMLVGRSFVSYLRHPFMLLSCFIWGAVMAQFVILVAILQPPFQVWVFMVLIAAFAPPAGLLHVFRQDIDEPFLRQFVRVDGLQLFFADASVPVIALASGGAVIWAIQPYDPFTKIFGVTFIFLASLVLALCGAYAQTTRNPLFTRFAATAVSFGVVAVVVTFFGAGFAVGALGLVAVVLAGIISAEA